MPGGSQPSGNTTSTTKSDPWSGQQPYLTDAFSSAQNLFKNYTPQYFKDSTVAPLSGATQAGINGMAATGADPNSYANLTGTDANAYTIAALRGALFDKNTANPNLNPIAQGSTVGSNPADGYFSAIARSNPNNANPATGQLNSVFSSANDNPASRDLAGMARGDYVGTQNPGFQGVVQQMSDALQPQIDGSFAANGRYGSGANANAFDSALTKETGDLAYQNYTTQQANQLAAAGQVGNNFNAGQATRLGAASANGNNYLAGTGLQLQGAQGLASDHNADVNQQLEANSLLSNNFNAGMTATNQALFAAPATQQTGYTGAQAQISAGQLQDQQNQAQVNDQVNRWNYNQNLPYNQLGNYYNIIGGNNWGGSSTTTQPYYGPSTGSQIMGGLGTAASLAGLFL